MLAPGETGMTYSRLAISHPVRKSNMAWRSRFNCAAILAAFVSCLMVPLSGVAALPSEIGTRFRFEDRHAQNADFPWATQGWADDQKAVAQRYLIAFSNLVPGLVDRATTFRPIALYRVERAGGFIALAVPAANALLISTAAIDATAASDGVPAAIAGPILFEMSRLADPVRRVADDPEWRRLVNPIIERVRAKLREKGISVSAALAKGGYDDIATNETLPSIGAALGPQEALAAYTSRFAVNEGAGLPAPIRAFVEKHLLSGEVGTDDYARRVQQALAALDAGESADALAFLDEAVAAEPKSPAAYRWRAEIRTRTGRFDEAMADYTKLAQFSTMAGEAYLGRARVHAALRKPDKAIEDVGKAIPLLPLPAQAYAFRGRLKLEKNSVDAAIVDFAKSVEANPAYVDGFGLLGTAYRRKGDWEKALGACDAMIALAPKSAAALHQRALVWIGKNDPERALADLDSAVSVDPDFAPAYIERGGLRRARKEYDRALADFDKAVALQPLGADPYLERAQLWFAKSDFAKARADLTRVIEYAPESWLGYWLRAQTWDKKTESDKALADVNQALERDSKNASALILRGHIWFGQGNYDAALADWNEVLKADANNAQVLIFSGGAKAAKRDYDGAIADFTKAAQATHPLGERLQALYYRARTYLRHGEDAKASADLEEIDRLSPESKEQTAPLRREIESHGAK